MSSSRQIKKPWLAVVLNPVILLMLAMVSLSRGQPKSELNAPPPLDPAEGQKVARALIARLLEQKPERAVTNTGVLKLRDAAGTEREIPTRFDIVPGSGSWLNVYEASAGPNRPASKLTIIHSDAHPNEYLLGSSGSSGKSDDSQKLSPEQTMAPFAGSDFWIADLGLEFLHWPEQRVIRKQMRKGLYCDVLQSTNPQPGEKGYSRVVSWIAVNRPEDIVIVHADAYDARGKLLKEFDPKKVERVNGVWQLEEMEIRNRQSGTRTRVDFNLGD